MQAGQLKVQQSYNALKAKIGIVPKRYSVGLDLGSCALKAVVLSSQGGDISLESVHDIPLGGVASHDAHQRALQSLQAALLKLGLMSKTPMPCQIALKDEQVITEFIPLRSPAKIQKIMHEIRPHIERQKAIWGEDLLFDVDILPSSVLGTKKSSALLVIAKTQDVTLLSKRFAELVWHPRVIDLESLALMRGLAYTLRRQPQHLQTLMVLDIGETKIMVLIILHNGLVAKSISPLNTEAKQNPAKLSDQLAQLIERSAFPFDNKVQQFPILICGGRFLDPRFRQAFQALLGKRILKVNPFQKIAFHQRLQKTKLDTCASLYLLSFGLALRGLDV